MQLKPLWPAKRSTSKVLSLISSLHRCRMSLILSLAPSMSPNLSLFLFCSFPHLFLSSSLSPYVYAHPFLVTPSRCFTLVISLSLSPSISCSLAPSNQFSLSLPFHAYISSIYFFVLQSIVYSSKICLPCHLKGELSPQDDCKGRGGKERSWNLLAISAGIAQKSSVDLIVRKVLTSSLSYFSVNYLTSGCSSLQRTSRSFSSTTTTTSTAGVIFSGSPPPFTCRLIIKRNGLLTLFSREISFLLLFFLF